MLHFLVGIVNSDCSCYILSSKHELKSSTVTMSYQLLFEDEKGKVVDENGNDPMEVPFQLEELSSCSLYIETREKFCKLLQSKCNFIEKTAKWSKWLKLLRALKKSKIDLRAKDELKVYIVHLVKIQPRNSARTAASGLNFQPRTFQR